MSEPEKEQTWDFSIFMQVPAKALTAATTTPPGTLHTSPPPLQGVARLAGYNPLTPDSVSRRPDFLFVQVTIALDALLMPLEGAFVLLRLNP